MNIINTSWDTNATNPEEDQAEQPAARMSRI